MPALDDERLRAALRARETARADYLAAADRLAVEVARALTGGATLQAVARELGVSRQAVAQLLGRAEKREGMTGARVPGRVTPARARVRGGSR